MEARLAQRFGVSRAPVRRALSELAERGIITRNPAGTRGYTVSGNGPAKEGVAGSKVSFDPHTPAAWQRVYSQIETEIVEAIVFGTWRLRETGIAHHFGVSRTVAREVLSRLQSHGLVVNERRGWLAPRLTERRVRDLYEMRALLEPAALKDIASDVPIDLCHRMAQDLRQAQKMPADAQLFDRLETQMHVTLLEGCRNTLLLRSIREHQSLILAHRFFYRFTSDFFDVEPFLAEHLAVIDALQDGQTKRAGDALSHHLTASADRAVRRLEWLSTIPHVGIPPYLEAAGESGTSR